MLLTIIGLLVYIEWVSELPTWLWCLAAAEALLEAFFKHVEAFLARRRDE